MVQVLQRENTSDVKPAIIWLAALYKRCVCVSVLCMVWLREGNFGFWLSVWHFETRRPRSTAVCPRTEQSHTR